MSISRRESLRILGLSSAGALAGCCLPSRHIRQNDLVDETYLATERIYSAQPNYTPCIDPHAHFFNVTDMQAGGYLAGPIASEWGLNNDKVSEVLRLIGLSVDHLGRVLGLSTRAENDYLTDLGFRVAGLDGEAIQQLIEQDMRAHNARIAEELFDRLQRVRANTLIEELLRSGSSPQSSSIQFDAVFLEGLLNEEPDIFENIYLNSNNDIIKLILGILVFTGYFLSYRTHNVYKYRKVNFVESDDAKIERAGHAIVDFDHWLGECDCPYSRLVDQAYLYDRISRIYGGYTFNLIGFNPWNAIKQGDDYFNLIEQALAYPSFRGVKIYPTIGYYPYGNAEISTPPRTTPHPDDMREVDSAMARLYEICGDQYPVMAHGGYSMGTLRSYRVFAGPTGWEKALSAYPRLKANIGHFGSDSTVDGLNWTDEFIQLMSQYQGLHADIGYWDELQRNPVYAGDFVRRLEQPIGNSEFAYHRVMYGTDWIMASKEPDWKRATTEIYRNFESSGASQEMLSAVFYDNARELYGLS